MPFKVLQKIKKADILQFLRFCIVGMSNAVIDFGVLNVLLSLLSLSSILKTGHVSLDLVHITQMNSLKRTLSEKAQSICPACGKHYEALQLHIVHFACNLFDRYNPRHFVVLCPACHEKVHSIEAT